MPNTSETFLLKVGRLCIKVNECEELTFCYPENYKCVCAGMVTGGREGRERGRNQQIHREK